MKVKINYVRLLIVLAIISVIAVLIVNAFRYKRHEISDFGVSIKTLRKYVDITEDNNLLTLYNSENDICVNVKYLGDAYWREDDMDVIMDQYIRLISAMSYDSNVYDVTYKKDKLDFKEVGIVEMTTDRGDSSSSVMTVLTHKSNGYIAIEIYGPTDVMKEHKKEAEKIARSVKFGENKHDYSKDRLEETSSGDTVENT